MVGPDLRGDAAGHLGHRGEQGQRAVGLLDRLVGDGGRGGLQQRVGALAGGGEVEVGEERLVLAQPVVLLGDRLLDLQQQVGRGPDLVGGAEEGGTGGGVLVVGDGGAHSGAPLHDHLVAVPHQLVHPGRGDRHTELVVLDLAGDADLHVDHGPSLRVQKAEEAGSRMLGDTRGDRGSTSLMKEAELSSLTKHRPFPRLLCVSQV